MRFADTLSFCQAAEQFAIASIFEIGHDLASIKFAKTIRLSSTLCGTWGHRTKQSEALWSLPFRCFLSHLLKLLVKIQGKPMKIHYLEIVTPDVDAACTLYSTMHGVTFGDADPNLGGARTAKLDDGGTLGIRAPLRETETPVVRPYVLVDDIDTAVSAASASGAEIAMTPTEIEGYGQFAIVIEGGIESGLWKV